MSLPVYVSVTIDLMDNSEPDATLNAWVDDGYLIHSTLPAPSGHVSYLLEHRSARSSSPSAHKSQPAKMAPPSE